MKSSGERVPKGTLCSVCGLTVPAWITDDRGRKWTVRDLRKDIHGTVTCAYCRHYIIPKQSEAA